MKVLRGFAKILFIITLVLNLQACSSTFDLTNNEIEMYIGETFTPSDYLRVDESSIKDVKISNNVNTNLPGTYEVHYELGDDKKTLKVTILGDPIIMLSTNVLIEKNAVFTPKNYIHKDSLKNDIKIDSNVNPKIVGDYSVVYSCNSIEKTLNVVVKQLEFSLNNTNITIDLGSTFTPKNHVTLNFPNSTNLSIKSNVDTNKIGDYKVTYSTEDLTKTLEVKVVDASPFLTTTETTINQGSSFNPLDYLVETDKINSSIIITNNVKLDVVGTYLVTYSLGKVQKTLSVNVIENQIIPIPIPITEAYELSIVSLTSPVSRGSNATITIKGKPGEEYSIEVHYKSGPSTAAGLESKTANANGEVTWTWKIGQRTTVGSWEIVITGDDQNVSTSITIY